MAEIILQPEDNDVLCGRGRYIMQWDGNIFYQELVKKEKERYRLGNNALKRCITEMIVHDIMSRDPPGRFLKLVDGNWIELDEAKAIKKTRQALRENNYSHKYQAAQKAADRLANTDFVVDYLRASQNESEAESESQIDEDIHELEEDKNIAVESKESVGHHVTIIPTSKVIVSNVDHKLPPKKVYESETESLLLARETNSSNESLNIDSKVDSGINYSTSPDEANAALPRCVTHDSLNFAREKGNSVNHRVSLYDSNAIMLACSQNQLSMLTESELKVNERMDALREAELLVNERIKALKHAELEIAEKIRALNDMGLFEENNGEKVSNQAMPEKVSLGTALNQQNSLPISYNVDQHMAIEALANAKKSISQYPNLFLNGKMNYNADDLIITEMIPSDHAIKNIDHYMKLKTFDAHKHPALKIKQEILEENTHSFKKERNSLTSRKTDISLEKFAKSVTMKSEEIGSINEIIFQGFTPNQLAVLGIGTDKKRQASREETDLFPKRVKIDATPEYMKSETIWS